MGLTKLKETDLSKPITDYFGRLFPNCEVFYEVKSQGSRKIDLVVRNTEGLIISCELKLNLNLKVFYQAHTNTDFSHYTFIAVPKKCVMRIKKDFIISICRALNIGILTINNKYTDFQVELYFHEVIEKKPKKTLKLFEGQKTFSQGGEANGGCYTEFKYTCEQIIAFLKESPNNQAELSEIIASIKHHYKNEKSAKSSLKKYLADGVIKGVILIGFDTVKLSE